MATKEKDTPELSDLPFESNLTFFTNHLNRLNLKFRNSKQIITIINDCVKSFKCKLLLWAKKIPGGNLDLFTSLQLLGRIVPQYLKEYADVILNMRTDFDCRFQEYLAIVKQFMLFVVPTTVDVDVVLKNFSWNFFEFQCDTLLKQKYGRHIPNYFPFLWEFWPCLEGPTLICDLRVMKLFWCMIYTLYCDLQQEKLHFSFYQETR